jgi:hypothetical protein
MSLILIRCRKNSKKASSGKRQQSRSNMLWQSKNLRSFYKFSLKSRKSLVHLRKPTIATMMAKRMRKVNPVAKALLRGHAT